MQGAGGGNSGGDSGGNGGGRGMQVVMVVCR